VHAAAGLGLDLGLDLGLGLGFSLLGRVGSSLVHMVFSLCVPSFINFLLLTGPGPGPGAWGMVLLLIPVDCGWCWHWRCRWGEVWHWQRSGPLALLFSVSHALFMKGKGDGLALSVVRT